MSLKVKELCERRAKLIKDAREVLDLKNTPSTEIEQRYDAIYKDIEALDKDIELEERQIELERKAATERFERANSEKQKEIASHETQNQRKSPRDSEEYQNAFRNYLRTGKDSLTADETRALAAGTDTTGGFLTSTALANELIQSVDNAVFIRLRARRFPLGANVSLGAPSLDTDVSDAAWTAEIGSASEDSSLALGKRELHPHKLTKLIKISNRLIEVSAQNVESIVKERFTYKFGVAEENAFLNGTGAQQPLGVFVASANGINTGQDVSTGNTATAIAADGLIETKHALKSQYWGNAIWIFSRTGIKQIRKLKDGEGNYLWGNGLAGQPATILDVPYFASEYCPATFTASQYVGIIGDFRFYWIADSVAISFQRLVELYAATDQTGLLARMYVDGMPVLEEAFVRVKLAAS